MKRILLAIFIILIVSGNIFATGEREYQETLDALNNSSPSTFYLGPFNAITNINLNAKSSWQSPRPVPEQGDGLTGTSLINNWKQPFDDTQIVVLGALYWVPYLDFSNNYGDIQCFDAKEYWVKFTIESDSFDGKYFWLTSQSNPDSKRPFNLQLAVEYRRENQSTDVRWTNGDDNLLDTFDLKQPQIQFERNDRNTIYYHTIIANVGIILPGEINNGTLTIDGKSYPIASASDYSSEITVTMTLMKGGYACSPDDLPRNMAPGSPVELSYTFPLSGFYDPTIEAGPDESKYLEPSSSLNINMLPKVANMDLLLDQGSEVPIANLEYAIYNINNNQALSSSAIIEDNDVFVFLSASSNPYAESKRGFEFVHTNVTSEEQKNNQNTIGYTITVQPDGSSEIITFDGKDFLSGDGSANPQNRITTEHHAETLSHASTDIFRHWHSVEASMNLTLDAVPYTLDEGYYRSYVYVHAIVNGDKVGGQ